MSDKEPGAVIQGLVPDGLTARVSYEKKSKPSTAEAQVEYLRSVIKATNEAHIKQLKELSDKISEITQFNHHLVKEIHEIREKARKFIEELHDR